MIIQDLTLGPSGNGPWGAGSYSYDGNGNRLTKVEVASSTSYSYYAGSNRLQTATGSEPGGFSYDPNGNTTGDGTRTYQYSQRDRMSTADSGTTGTYSYDGDGRRVKKVAGGTTTLYFYDAEGRLLEEYIPASNTGKDYLWMPGTYEPLARVDFSLSDADTGNVLRCTKSSPDVHLDWSLFAGSGNFLVRSGALGVFNSCSLLNSPSAQKTLNDPVLTDSNSYWYDVRNRTLTDALYFYHADHLGTPLAMTNKAGALVWQAEQYPFGGIYALTVGTISNNLRFPGQYWDGETGLSQNFFRDCSSTLGRFFQPDPVDLRYVTHLYPYASDNPLFWKDAKGLFNDWDYPFHDTPRGGIAPSDPCCQQSWTDCWQKCVEKYRLDSVLPLAFSAVPKRPFFRVPKKSQPITTPLSGIAHCCRKWPKIAKPMRAAGRGLSRIGTPLAIFEGFYDIGTMLRCAIVCGDDPCSN